MNKVIFFLAFLFITGISKAQHTVSIGSGYANQVWYKLDGGQQQSASADSWDLAFDATNSGAAVRINGKKGIRLWTYPSADTSGWSTVDTVGISSWKEAFDSDTSWQTGAFQAGIDYNDPFDLGWGKYSIITHNVIGDSIYLVQLANGNYQKLWIEELSGGAYIIRHASLDNMMDMTHTIAKPSNKNFVYFSLANHQVLDLEPQTESWDLLFTGYIGFIPVPYGVTGVLSNYGVEIAEAAAVDTANDTHSGYPFNTEINTIGFDWKSFNMNTFQWEIQDSLAYFVKTQNGDVWKVIFIDFGGSSNGNFVFTKKKVSTGSGTTTIIDGKVVTFTTYPNPVVNDGEFQLIYDLPQMTMPSTLTITDINGKIMEKRIVKTTGRLTAMKFDSGNWNSGVYLLSMEYPKGILTTKVVIE